MAAATVGNADGTLPIMESPSWSTSPDAESSGTDRDDTTTLDLDAIENALAAVEASLERLEAGTYGICEVTGAELSDEVLAIDPMARRRPDSVIG